MNGKSHLMPVMYFCLSCRLLIDEIIQTNDRHVVDCLQYYTTVGSLPTWHPISVIYYTVLTIGVSSLLNLSLNFISFHYFSPNYTH